MGRSTGTTILYREIIAASRELERDAERRAHWQDILDRMSEYPLQAWENTVTFRPDSVHDGVIRIFPNWDRTVDAQFKRLRAVGAFLVEATYRASGQVVGSVRIFSEQGHPCVLQSPFDGAGIEVTRADNRQPVTTVQDEEVFTFRTEAGVT